MKVPSLTITRRHVQLALGWLWLLDGALQLQHQMFTSNFATQVIDPAVQGQPHFVTAPTQLAVRIFLTHPAVYNSLIAATQLGLGLAILWKRTLKWGLLASVVWGLFVWSIGEGYGGIFAGGASLLMGSPGAAILYSVLALAVLPTDNRTVHKLKEKFQQQATGFWLIFAWALLWLGGMFWQITTSGQNTVSGMASMILMNADGAPHWLATIDIHTASLIRSFGVYVQPMASMQHMSTMQMAQMPTQAGSGGWFAPVLAVVMLLICMGVFFKGWVRMIAVTLGCLLTIVFWVVGQSLGAYYTGLATDPSTAPLVVLLGLAVLGNANLDIALRQFLNKTEDLLIGAPAKQQGLSTK